MTKSLSDQHDEAVSAAHAHLEEIRLSVSDLPGLTISDCFFNQSHLVLQTTGDQFVYVGLELDDDNEPEMAGYSTLHLRTVMNLSILPHHLHKAVVDTETVLREYRSNLTQENRFAQVAKDIGINRAQEILNSVRLAR
jgi:hypothetical protein